jgi:hypothetical protein
MAHPRGFEPLASAFGGQPETVSQRAQGLISGAFDAERLGNLRLRLELVRVNRLQSVDPVNLSKQFWGPLKPLAMQPRAGEVNAVVHPFRGATAFADGQNAQRDRAPALERGQPLGWVGRQADLDGPNVPADEVDAAFGLRTLSDSYPREIVAHEALVGRFGFHRVARARRPYPLRAITARPVDVVGIPLFQELEVRAFGSAWHLSVVTDRSSDATLVTPVREGE